MTDRFVVRAVVIFLGVISLTCMAGGLWLAAHDRSLPDSLISIGSTALGGLVGFLISSKSNPADQVLPTVEAPVTVTPGDA